MKLDIAKELLTHRNDDPFLKEFLLTNQNGDTLLKEISPKELPKIVFAAIDNDLLPMAGIIKNLLLTMNVLPIIGEAALNSYIVSEYYGQKALILRDCLPLIDFCDQFMIFINHKIGNPDEILELADGVLYELAHWFSKNDKPVTVISLSNYQDIETPYETLDSCTITKSFFKDFIEKNEQQKSDIYSKLNYHQEHMHLTRGITIPTTNVKHCDWFRLNALKEERVPVCPYALFDTSTMKLAKKNKQFEMLSHAVIIAKCSEICVYGATDGTKDLLKQLSTEVLLELYLTLTLSPNLKILYKSFSEVNIPKYAKAVEWAITHSELDKTKKEFDGTLSSSDNGFFKNISVLNGKSDTFEPKVKL